MGRPKGTVKFDADAKERFLEHYRETGALYKSAEYAGVTSTTVYDHRGTDDAFAQAMDEAKGMYRDAVSTEVRRRAIEGWEEAVYQRGEKVGTIRKYSDRMLELEAKRHEPEYRDKQQVDVNHTGGVLVVGSTSQSDAEWAKQWASLHVDASPAGEELPPRGQLKRG